MIDIDQLHRVIDHGGCGKTLMSLNYLVQCCLLPGSRRNYLFIMPDYKMTRYLLDMVRKLADHYEVEVDTAYWRSNTVVIEGNAITFTPPPRSQVQLTTDYMVDHHVARPPSPDLFRWIN